ncbi:hypothetical protein OE88DRAFT_895852 [Heliocybe sulcata]|uniref:Uncharacterized protein n=1 Tax=Heliocybe sulcata TaxID=5364 RepID=A0A5C3MQ74_9AGAM|nr:hypothetical protein OE88DRAFT_895852 [Heliocybe sulcata]
MPARSRISHPSSLDRTHGHGRTRTDAIYSLPGLSYDRKGEHACLSRRRAQEGLLAALHRTLKHLSTGATLSMLCLYSATLQDPAAQSPPYRFALAPSYGTVLDLLFQCAIRNNREPATNITSFFRSCECFATWYPLLERIPDREYDEAMKCLIFSKKPNACPPKLDGTERS